MTTPLLRRGKALGAVGALALALTGCGAGLDAYTYQERPQAENVNLNLQPLAIRDVHVKPPSNGRTYEAGGEAFGGFTVSDTGTEGDTLLGITSPDAAEVVPTVDGRPVTVEVPPRGTTGTSTGFVLRGLNADLRSGEYVTLVFEFEQAGTVEALVPVRTTGRTDRPAFTGEPGSEEGEPALQGPAGGQAEEEGAAEGGEGEPGSGDASIGEGEQGQEEVGSVEAEPGAEPATEGEPAAEPEASPAS